MEAMDQIKSNNISAFSQNSKARNYLIKVIQLLVPLSLFSFFIPPSSFLAFLYHFNFYFSTFSFQLFTHTIDKNCMFLLCNGLLVFLGIARSLSGSSSVGESYKYVEDASQSSYSDVEANEPIMLVGKEVMEKIHEPDGQNTEAAHAIEIKYSEEGEENIGDIVLEGEEEGKGDRESGLKEETHAEIGSFGGGDEEKESESDQFLIEEIVEEEEVVEPNCVLSTEELNKKFDEFIRRMKEDLMIEARRQLLVV
ncbi:hypothetical protein Fmac_014033 [Flemingia macrophylla]|uniref:Uncharacterized protein n=1 Tax=Flemingia macrophylla TaxID=520843 RepID=A0ABD1MAN0_9FABA